MGRGVFFNQRVDLSMGGGEGVTVDVSLNLVGGEGVVQLLARQIPINMKSAKRKGKFPFSFSDSTLLANW
jgi:hypothetical protein